MLMLSCCCGFFHCLKAWVVSVENRTDTVEREQNAVCYMMFCFPDWSLVSRLHILVDEPVWFVIGFTGFSITLGNGRWSCSTLVAVVRWCIMRLVAQAFQRSDAVQVCEDSWQTMAYDNTDTEFKSSGLFLSRNIGTSVYVSIRQRLIMIVGSILYSELHWTTGIMFTL